MHNQTCSKILNLLQKALLCLRQVQPTGSGFGLNNAFNELLQSAQQVLDELTVEEKQDFLVNFLTSLPWRLVKDESGNLSHTVCLDVEQSERPVVEIMFSVIQLNLNNSFTTQVKLSHSVVRIEVDYDEDGHLTLPQGTISIDGKPSLNYHGSCLVTLTMGQAHQKRSILGVKAVFDPAYEDDGDTSNEQPFVGSIDNGNDFEF